MTKKQRAKFIQKHLDSLCLNPEIPLDYTDAYTCLVAVLLSAQCTDIKVNKVTPILFKRANNAFDMTKIPLEQIEKIIKPCGLSNSKAKYIKSLSEDICNKFNGKVPQTFKELESLAGVGHKTASVVMSQIFNKPAFAVDTHIHRLATKWKLTSGKSVEQTEADLKELFPEKTWQKLHLQIIWYGRNVCPAHKCKKTKCPLCS